MTGGAWLELWAGSKRLWKEKLLPESSPTGLLVRHRFRVPKSLFQEKDPFIELTGKLFPEKEQDNLFWQNDSLPLVQHSPNASRQLFLRPLRSYEARGLIDALFAAESLEVTSITFQELEEKGSKKGDILWVASDSPLLEKLLVLSKRLGLPIILYAFPDPNEKLTQTEQDPRIAWTQEMDGFMPPEVVRLGDLGPFVDLGGFKNEGRKVSKENGVLSDLTPEPLIWIEEKKQQRALLSRRRTLGQEKVYEFFSFPYWKNAFLPEVDERVLGLQRRWIQGVAEFVSHQSQDIWVLQPEVLVVDQPFQLHIRLTGNNPRLKHPRIQIYMGTLLLGTDSSTKSEFDFNPIQLGAGRSILTMQSHGMELWRETFSLNPSKDLELSRLGVDEEKLTALASSTGGALCQFRFQGSPSHENAWPDLAQGQIQEIHKDTQPLFPLPWGLFSVAGLFCIIWGMRKKFQLD